MRKENFLTDGEEIIVKNKNKVKVEPLIKLQETKQS
jgi:hypothetical protein